jgi:hypothetical protein
MDGGNRVRAGRRGGWARGARAGAGCATGGIGFTARLRRRGGIHAGCEVAAGGDGAAAGVPAASGCATAAVGLTAGASRLSPVRRRSSVVRPAPRVGRATGEGWDGMTRSASCKLLDEMPSPDEMLETLSELKLTDDTAAILMGVAYLDHGFELLLLKSKFCNLTAAEDKRLFDDSQNGILGTFSSKVRVSYAMRILIGPVYEDLLVINDIPVQAGQVR